MQHFYSPLPNSAMIQRKHGILLDNLGKQFSKYDIGVIHRVSSALIELDSLVNMNRSIQKAAEYYAYISRYADDICNMPPSKVFALAKVIGTIFCGAVELEDTANYVLYDRNDGPTKYAHRPLHRYWTSFLDARFDLDPITLTVTSQLYTKAGILPFTPIGTEIYHSNTSSVMFARVFGSEALRFYKLCSFYEHFIAHVSSYLSQFLDKGYPLALLLTSLLKIFKKHPSGRYGNHPINWLHELRGVLPGKYTQHWYIEQLSKLYRPRAPRRLARAYFTPPTPTTPLATPHTPIPHAPFPRQKINFVPGGIIGGQSSHGT